MALSRILGSMLGASLLLSVAAGCGGGKGEGDDPYTPDRIAKIKPALQFKAIIVHPFTVAKTVDDPGAAPTDCHDATVSYLNQKHLFDNVGGDGSPGAPGTLVVDGYVEDLRIVGGGARFWAGAFAGKSHMDVKVVAHDAATGALVSEQLIQSDNNAFGAAWSFGASDRGLPTDMGPVVADFIISAAQSSHPVAAAGGAAPASSAAP